MFVSVDSCLLLHDLDALEGSAVPTADAGDFNDSDAAADANDAGPATSDAGSDAGRHCLGDHGPVPVVLDAYCMDSTEVTGRDYLEFIAASGSVPRTPECSWKDDFDPVVAPGSNELPVFGADWCDAQTYCAWAGKRLCGAIGGGAVADTLRANANSDEWFRACSHDGDQAYPYGTSRSPNACNVHDRDGGGRTSAVGTLPGCEGGYPGLFDLSGNLWEWEDGCTEGGASAQCAVRGSSFAAVNDGACKTVAHLQRDRGGANDVTIRCCSDLVP